MFDGKKGTDGRKPGAVAGNDELHDRQNHADTEHLQGSRYKQGYGQQHQGKARRWLHEVKKFADEIEHDVGRGLDAKLLLSVWVDHGWGG